MTLFSLKLFPFIALGPQKPQQLTASKIKYEKFGPKILTPRSKWIPWCPNISRNRIFQTLRIQCLQLFDPKIFQILIFNLSQKITLISMIKKMALTFLDIKKWL